uniref:Divalent-cation tolerance protein CutA n=1 Tax=Panagrellus redivivus TaxID=6233 RepID=A0A7E4ZWH1_PANRE
MTSAVFSVVYVTVPNAEVAQKLARSSVEAKLAACVNIVPGIKSVYLWKGAVEEDNELLLIIKTKNSSLECLKDHILKNHPYDVPEFISLPIESGSEPYLNWINEQVGGKATTTPNPTAAGGDDKHDES